MPINRRYLKQSLVGFIDLLGFSDRTRSIGTLDHLAAIETDVRRVQEWFEHRPKDEDIKQSQKIASKQVLAFSDCVVVSVPVSSSITRFQGSFDTLMSELNSFALAQGQCAVNGIFVRGGVDLGLWYRRGATMISPAMVGAYELEKAASVPMIALSQSLYDSLANHPDRGQYSDDLDPITNDLVLGEGLPNGQRHWFIDYLPTCLGSLEPSFTAAERAAYQAADADTRQGMRDTRYHEATLQFCRQHREAIRAAHASATIDTVRQKYVWLAAYHDAALHRFYLTPPEDLRVGAL